MAELMSPSMELPTILNTGGNGTQMPLGTGFIGGLILASLWNGGWGGGFGNRGGQAAADVAIANQIEHVSDQVTQGTISGLQSAQGVQNAINASALANVQSQNATAMATQGAINAGTMATMQGNAAISDKICCSTGRLSQEIDSTGDGITAAITDARVQSMANTQLIKDGLCGINQNISQQSAATQLLATQLASQLQAQHADLKATIQQENCADRELMREIAAQATRDELGKAQAKIVQLETQNYVNQSNSQQTLYLTNVIEQLKTTAAAARTTTATTGA